MKTEASATDQQVAKAQHLIDKVVEPKIREIVEQLNTALKSHGVHVGVECQWYIGKAE